MDVIDLKRTGSPLQDTWLPACPIPLKELPRVQESERRGTIATIRDAECHVIRDSSPSTMHARRSVIAIPESRLPLEGVI